MDPRRAADGGRSHGGEGPGRHRGDRRCRCCLEASHVGDLRVREQGQLSVAPPTAQSWGTGRDWSIVQQPQALLSTPPPNAGRECGVGAAGMMVWPRGEYRRAECKPMQMRVRVCTAFLQALYDWPRGKVAHFMAGLTRCPPRGLARAPSA